MRPCQLRRLLSSTRISRKHRMLALRRSCNSFCRRRVAAILRLEENQGKMKRLEDTERQRFFINLSSDRTSIQCFQNEIIWRRELIRSEMLFKKLVILIISQRFLMHLIYHIYSFECVVIIMRNVRQKSAQTTYKSGFYYIVICLLE